MRLWDNARSFAAIGPLTVHLDCGCSPCGLRLIQLLLNLSVNRLTASRLRLLKAPLFSRLNSKTFGGWRGTNIIAPLCINSTLLPSQFTIQNLYTVYNLSSTNALRPIVVMRCLGELKPVDSPGTECGRVLGGVSSALLLHASLVSSTAAPQVTRSNMLFSPHSFLPG